MDILHGPIEAGNYQEVRLEAIDQLKEVQRLQGKISLYETEIHGREARIRSATGDLEVLKNEAAPIEGRLSQGSALVRKLELDVAEVVEKIEKTQQQLDAATQASEFTGLKAQLSNFGEEKAVLEENVMLVMEKLDELRAQKEDAGQRMEIAVKQLEELRSEIDASTKEYRDEMGALQEPLKVARSNTDPELLELFDRLYPSIGATVVVSLDGDTCGGCHLNVSSQIRERAQSGQGVVYCPSCARIFG